MNLNNPAYKLSLRERLRLWLLGLLDGVDNSAHKDGVDNSAHKDGVGLARCIARQEGYDDGYRNGELTGELRARIKFAVLPLPFTPEEMAGRHYGEFVTPIGFGTQFGECNIPAPGQHGYEQRAYYVAREDLDLRASEVDLRCHGIAKFGKDVLSGGDSNLVPVIVTVLR